jgi:hypothetical protein
VPISYTATMPLAGSQLLLARRARRVSPPPSGVRLPGSSLSLAVGQKLAGSKWVTDVLTLPKKTDANGSNQGLVEHAPLAFVDIHGVANGSKPNMPHSNLGLTVKYLPRTVWNNLNRQAGAAIPKLLEPLLKKAPTPEDAGFALLAAAQEAPTGWRLPRQGQSWQFVLRRTDSDVPLKGPHPHVSQIVASPERHRAEQDALRTDVFPLGREVIFLPASEGDRLSMTELHHRSTSADFASFLLSPPVVTAAERLLDEGKTI